MRRFLLLWAGQLISLLGSGLTSFALAVHIYQQTGDVGDLAWIAGAVYLPQILIAPGGGVLADRLDRRRLMIAADCGAAAATAAMFACVAAGQLVPWSATLLVAAGACCNALQWPAYEAAIVTLVPREQLGRASGLLELSRGASQLLAPLLAGLLFGLIGLGGIILVDLASFAAGVAPLLFLRFPSPSPRAQPRRGIVRGVADDLGAAWRLIARQPGLVAMLALFFVTTFTFAVVELLLKPLILSFATPVEVGLVLSAVGVGMVIGSLTMAAWGGPRHPHKIAGILLFQLVEGASLVVGAARPSFPLLCSAALAYGLVIPLTFGCARTIWQVRVPPELQGRVAALRNALVAVAVPLGYAIAVPLATWAEALMAADSRLAATLGRLIGSGAGRGAALVVIAMGALTCAAAVAAHAFGPYRHLEREPAALGAAPWR